MNRQNAQERYHRLKKPSWAPSEELFMYAWSVLYVFIAISFGALFYSAGIGIVSWVVTIPFFLNLLANLLYYPIQFWVGSNIWSTVIIAIVLATIIWGTSMIWASGIDEIQWIAYLNIPYLLWILYAGSLQIEILRLNGD